MVLLGIAAFGLTLEYLGFVAAVIALVVVAACADPDLSRWRSPGVAVFMVVFSIARLRRPARPAAAGSGRPSERAHGHLRQSRARLRRRRHAQEPRLLLRRRVPRHADRRAARHRPGRDGGDAAAADLQPRSRDLDDHARRHLLRRAIWRLDHRDPGQHSGRSPRRSSPRSTATRWRAAAAPALRSASRRSARSSPAPFATLLVALFSPPLADHRAEVPAGRLLLADGVRPDRRGGAGARLAAQGHRHGGARPGVRPRRHRRQFRRDALHLRHPGARRGHQLRRAGDGHVRHRRGRLQPRAARPGPPGVHLAARPRAAEPRRSQPQHVVDRARHRARLAARHPAGRRRAAGVVCRLHDREEGREAAARFRRRRHPRRRRARSPPTMPARRPRSSRC